MPLNVAFLSLKGVELAPKLRPVVATNESLDFPLIGLLLIGLIRDN